MNALMPKQSGFKALSQEQQEEHRIKIGVRAEAILDQFWRDGDTSSVVQILELEGWMDVLETCSHPEFRKAWADYQKTGPRTARGTLIKPDAGAIYRLAIRDRPKPAPVIVNEPQRIGPKATREEANAIMKEYGFKPQTFGN